MNTGRIEKQEVEDNYAKVPNDICQSMELSLEQKGLMAFLLSLPKDWVVYKDNLHELLGDKKNKVYQKFNNNLKENLVSWYFCNKDIYKTYLKVINNNLFRIDHLITGPNKRILIQNTYFRSCKNN